MKKILLPALLLLGFGSAFSQNQNVGIGTTTPDASAILDLTSTSKGFLAPRVTSAERAAIATPANGLLIYDITVGCYFYYNTAWVSLCQLSGPVGPQGATGANGAAGAQGATGVPGPQGPAGATGPQGSTGVQGPMGPQGPQGVTGAQGTNGNNGATGPSGNDGATGLQGVAGAPGIQGATGATGLQGVPGATGSQGIQGTTGAQGIQGVTGTQGIQGVTGAVGATGAQGVQGVTGAQGIQGPTGAIGATGVQGIQGSTGSQGIQGIQGVTGTQGIQGIQGVTGAQGVQGLQGIQGIQGVTGTQGIQGLIGPTGPNWTITNFAFNTSGTLNITTTDPQNLTTASGAWLTTGNNGITASNFIGTVNAADFIIKSNNTERARILSTGEILTGSTTVVAPAVAGDKFSAYMVVNNNNWAINGINTVVQGGSVYGANTSTSNGFNSIEATSFYSGTTYAQSAVFGLAISSVATNTAIGVQGTNNGSSGVGVEGTLVTLGSGFGGMFYNSLGYTNGLFNMSDERVKTNIESIKGALEIIESLRGVTYQHRLDEYPHLGLGDGKQYGFIAQELEKVLPEAVKLKNLNVNACTPGSAKSAVKADIQQFKMVNYITVVPILVEAIKEQQKQIEDQQKQINELTKLVKK